MNTKFLLQIHLFFIHDTMRSNRYTQHTQQLVYKECGAILHLSYSQVCINRFGTILLSFNLSVTRVGCHGNTPIIQFNVDIGWNGIRRVLLHQMSLRSLDSIMSGCTELVN